MNAFRNSSLIKDNTEPDVDFIATQLQRRQEETSTNFRGSHKPPPNNKKQPSLYAEKEPPTIVEIENNSKVVEVISDTEQEPGVEECQKSPQKKSNLGLSSQNVEPIGRYLSEFEKRCKDYLDDNPSLYHVKDLTFQIETLTSYLYTVDLSDLTCTCEASLQYPEIPCLHTVTTLVMTSIRKPENGLDPHLDENEKEDLRQTKTKLMKHPSFRFESEDSEINRQNFIKSYLQISGASNSAAESPKQKHTKENDHKDMGNKEQQKAPAACNQNPKNNKSKKISQKKRETNQQTSPAVIVHEPKSNKNDPLPETQNQYHPDQDDHKQAKQYINERDSNNRWYVTTAPSGKYQCPNHPHNSPESKIRKGSITFVADFLKIVPKNFQKGSNTDKTKKIENTRRFFHANNDCLRMENFSGRPFTNLSPPFSQWVTMCDLEEDQRSIVKENFPQMKYVDTSSLEDEFEEDLTASQVIETTAITDHESPNETSTSLYSPSTEPSSEELVTKK